MDYSSIINLALVTVIYSTFIAPSLTKLGSIRNEIIDVDFPLTLLDEATDQDELRQVSTRLKKKLTSYRDSYFELKRFLKRFYIILAVFFVLQAILFVRAGHYTFESWSPLLLAALVIIVLISALQTYMLPPWKVSSLSWLINKGIPERALADVFGAKLTINQKTRNATEHDADITRISIISHLKLVGYRYIMAIESIDGERLYYASAGMIARHINALELIRSDGFRRNEIVLASVRLKPNRYRARVIFFNSPFEGKYNPSETELAFTVGAAAASPTTELNILKPSSRINSVIKDQKIISLAVNENGKGDNSLVALLTSKPFQRVIGKAHRPIVLESYNGNLGRYEIDKYCTRHNLLARHLSYSLRYWNRKRKLKSPYLALVPRRKR